jgi:hypothetical protein
MWPPVARLLCPLPLCLLCLQACTGRTRRPRPSWKTSWWAARHGPSPACGLGALWGAPDGRFAPRQKALAAAPIPARLSAPQIFCKSAAARGVVPPGWDWSKLGAKAVGLLPYAFEKDDARDKYGGENVFAGMMGGRSLRYTAIVALGFGAEAGGGMAGDDPRTADALREHERLHGLVVARWPELLAGSDTGGGGGGGASAGVFADVGGASVWQRMEARLRAHGRLGATRF